MDKYVVGTVLTSCEDNKYRMVKVKSEGIWTESPLLLSVNQIYLSKDDRVLIDIEESPIIVGKIFDDLQLAVSQQGDGTILFESKNESDYIQSRISKEKVVIKTSKGVEVSITLENVDVKATVITIEAPEVTLKSDEIKLDGKISMTHDIASPNGKGGFCGLKNCLFSGGPHTTSETT